jgi:hypothetical protein
MFPAVKHPFDRLDFEVVRMGMDTLTGAIKNRSNQTTGIDPGLKELIGDTTMEEAFLPYR